MSAKPISPALSRRDPRPGAMRHEDGALLGMGCAAAAYGVFLMPSAARVRVASDRRAQVWAAAHDLGIVGMNAAVANAVFHATGVRVRKTPIQVNDLVGGLPGRTT